jgi:hypothetical protein
MHHPPGETSFKDEYDTATKLQQAWDTLTRLGKMATAT